MKTFAPKPVKVLPESPPSHSILVKKPKCGSNYLNLHHGTNSTPSLALWLMHEPRYAFHSFRAERRWVWNTWAEGKCSSFRSQHIGNHKVECVRFVLVSAFNVPGFPLGNACLPSPWPFSFRRSQVRFHPLCEALSVNSGGIVWVPHADFMWGWQNSLPPFESTSLVDCLYFWDI